MGDAGPLTPLSLSYHNFYPGFDPGTHFLTNALRDRFDVTIDRIGRDVQISSVFGHQPLPRPAGGSRPLRVWWTGESQDPQWQFFDLHFGFWPSSLLGSRWHRLPLWVVYIDWWDAASSHGISRLTGPRAVDVDTRPRFCNFIFTAQPSIRTEFFARLNAARRVDSFGRVLNNVSEKARERPGKMRILSESRFTIAFENTALPGYVTEKLLEPLLAGSIPIYWGAPEAKVDFNPEAFICANDFASLDDVVAHVLKIADSKDAMTALASASPFCDNRVPYEHTPAFYADRIVEALESGFRPTAGLPEGPWTTGRDVVRRHVQYRLRRTFDRLLGRSKKH